MTITVDQYTFGYSRNSYFNGSDGSVTRERDGRTLTMNIRNGYMAVNVKDRHAAWIGEPMPADVQAMATDLQPDPFDFEGGAVQRCYEGAAAQWWEDAGEIAQDIGDVYADGRSGGWCVIEGTRDLADDFPSIDRPGNPAEVERLEDPDQEGDYELECALVARDAFLAVAFELLDNMDAAREDFYERIREEHAELEARRESCIVRGEN